LVRFQAQGAFIFRRGLPGVEVGEGKFVMIVQESLKVEIVDDGGNVLKVVELPDPRNAYCESYNGMWKGSFARPVPSTTLAGDGLG
jgi:hypothetical protein